MDTLVDLNDKHVLLDLKATNRFSAYSEILQHLFSIGDIPMNKVSEIESTLVERETMTTFAVGKNIAIPHINGTELKECIFAYARSTDGIDFGSCDSGLIHHLFLALIPEKKKCGWLKTLSRTARTLCECNLRAELMSTDSSQQAAHILQERLTA